VAADEGCQRRPAEVLAVPVAAAAAAAAAALSTGSPDPCGCWLIQGSNVRVLGAVANNCLLQPH
jgi:hypothetical protein